MDVETGAARWRSMKPFNCPSFFFPIRPRYIHSRMHAGVDLLGKHESSSLGTATFSLQGAGAPQVGLLKSDKSPSQSRMECYSLSRRRCVGERCRGRPRSHLCRRISSIKLDLWVFPAPIPHALCDFTSHSLCAGLLLSTAAKSWEHVVRYNAHNVRSHSLVMNEARLYSSSVTRLWVQRQCLTPYLLREKGHFAVSPTP